MSENIKKISDWQVLTPSGWQDFEGVKKVSKPYALKVTLEDDSFVICSGGHQLYVLDKETDESAHLFADLIQPFVMSIETKDNGFQTVVDVEKIEEEQELFDLVNVAHGYEYYTNNIVSHNCAHVEGIDELWLGLWPTLSCLAGNTKIFTDKGIFNIEDFHKDRSVGEYFELDNVKAYGKNGLETVSHGYVSPESDTLVFTTKHGYTVETTLKHPLWTLDANGGGMVEAGKLKIGDSLRIQTGMNCYGKNSLDPDLAYMLGGYIAEGNIKRRVRNKNKRVEYTGIQIVNSDSEFREVFLQKAEKTILGKNFTASDKRPLVLVLYSTEAVKRLEELGINKSANSHNKQTPKSIFTSNRETQRNYLSGLFDGDGSVGDKEIKLELTSKTLIEETQLLLSNMGFHTNICYKSNKQKPAKYNVKTAHPTWTLLINKSEFKKFSLEIGFKITRKQNKLDRTAMEFDKSIKGKNDPSRCSMEVIRPTLLELIEKSGRSKWWFECNGLKTGYLSPTSKTKQVGHGWLHKFKTLLEQAGETKLNEKDEQFFNNVSSPDKFFWDPIVSITKSHNKTYDFTVPGSHTFIQSGILGSNTGGSAILISSPSGVGTLFHKIWVGAKDGEDGEGKPNPGKGTNSFYRVELPWTVHPERDEEWFESQRSEILPAKGERGVAQELLCSFAASGENFLSGDVIEAMELQILPPIATYGDRGNVWIWKYAEPGHKYIASADVSRGDADDFSTIIIIDTNTDEVVCEYQGKCPPEQLAELLLDLGGKYNNALLCPELNSFGMIVATALKKSSYPNVYYDKIHKNAYMGYTTADIKDELPGWTTGPKNRDEMLAKLETVIRTKRIKIYSSRIVEEFKTFIWKNNKAQAMKGYADDLCVTGDTFIQTLSGVKPIIDVNVGDMVLTHRGRYRPVLKKFVNYKTEYSVLKSAGNLDLNITSNHPIYVSKRSKATWKDWEKTASWVKLSEPEFLPIEKFENGIKHYTTSVVAHEITANINSVNLLSYTKRKGFYVTENGLIKQNIVRRTAYNKPCKEFTQNNPKFISIPEHLPVNEKFCFILGYYLAEGSCYKNGISFAFNSLKEQAMAGEVKKYFDNLGFSTSIYNDPSTNSSALMIHSVLLKDFFHSFGKSSDKHLSPEFLSLPAEKLFQILVGYLAGDGCITKTGAIRASSISPNIVFLMRNICLINGISSSLWSSKNCEKSATFRGKTCSVKKQYVITINSFDAQKIVSSLIEQKKDVSYLAYGEYKNKKSNQSMCKIRTGYQHNEINHIENAILPIPIPLYNLEVEEDNSYVANGIVVHNCIALAIGNSLYEASGVNAWDDKELTMAMLSGMSKGTVTMSPIGSAGGFGQKNTVNMPPIMTSEGVRTVAQLQDFQNKREVAKQGPQNMRNPYYSQWAWVLNDNYGTKPEKK